MTKQTSLEKLSDFANIDERKIKVIKNTVAKSASDTELAMFLNVASRYDLDPVAGEIYFMKTRGKPQIMLSRDGFLTVAQKQESYAGLASMEVYENDDFKIDWGKREIEHNQNLTDPGKLVGAWAKADRKGYKSGIEFVRFKEFNKNNHIWKNYPREMIKKVAETRVLKKTFGINGVVSEVEMGKEKEKESEVEEIMTDGFEKIDEPEVVDPDLDHNNNTNEKETMEEND